MPSSDFCVPLHAFADICTHHTLHQGGSRRLLSFFSLSEHAVSFFFSTVLLVSLASFFFSSSLPSLSPLFPLLFRSSAVAGAKNPGDTHTQAVLGNSLRIHFDTAGFEAQRKHTHHYTHTSISTNTAEHIHSPYTPPAQPHINTQLDYLQLDGDCGIVLLFFDVLRNQKFRLEKWQLLNV